MVERSDLMVSFLVAFAFWMVARVVAVIGHWEYSLFSISTPTMIGLVLMGIVAVFFSSLLFGRTVFLTFFLLGVMTSPVIGYSSVFLNIAVGVALSLAGVVGVLLGQKISADLQEDDPLKFKDKGLILLVVASVVLCVGVGFFSEHINSFNEKSLSVARDVRDGKSDWVSAVARLAGTDYNSAMTPDPNGAAFDPNQLPGRS